jgi:hypothetical protein
MPEPEPAHDPAFDPAFDPASQRAADAAPDTGPEPTTGAQRVAGYALLAMVGCGVVILLLAVLKALGWAFHV